MKTIHRKLKLYKLPFSVGFHQSHIILNSNNMNFKKLLFGLYVLLATTALFSSCTKVIDVDVDSKEAKYVVEAFVTLGESTHQVKITKTLNIDEANAFPTVDNAVVIISDDLGNIGTMTFVGSGMYEVTGFLVEEGRTYSLEVSVDGKTFNASGTMANDVQIDTVTTFPFEFGPSTINAIIPIRMDPEGIANYYQFNLYEAGNKISGIYIQSDQFNDGNPMMEPIFAEGIDSGDTILVEMFGIDRSVYDYFFTLLQNQQGATPANPTSNFSGGCLGYFSVRTKDTMSVIIP